MNGEQAQQLVNAAQMNIRTKLTQQELNNVEDGLTTDGRKITICDGLEHCPCGCGCHFGCFLDDWGLSK